MRSRFQGLARVALGLAAAAVPAIAQPPSSSTGTPVRKDVPTTTTSRGETARDTASRAAPAARDTTRRAMPAARDTTSAAMPSAAMPSPAMPSAAPPSAAMPSAAMPSAAPSGALDAPSASIVASLQTDAHAMGLLHASNVAEIQAGTLAQQRARDADVRAFAARMVTEHTALDQQGDSLASRLGVTAALPDSALPQLATQAMTTLTAAGDTTTAAAAMPRDSTAGGASFDRAYVAQQVTDHQRTLALVDAAIARAQNADLRSALQSQIRPRVAAHLDEARQLQQRLGAR